MQQQREHRRAGNYTELLFMAPSTYIHTSHGLLLKEIALRVQMIQRMYNANVSVGKRDNHRLT